MHAEQLCCNELKKIITTSNSAIGYSKRFREYYLYLVDDIAIQLITHCPICGKMLPKPLNQEYFSILENEYNINDPFEAKEQGLLPKEFLTDEWWKQRNL